MRFSRSEKCDTIGSEIRGDYVFKITINQVEKSKDEEIVINCHEISDEVLELVGRLKRTGSRLPGELDGETYMINTGDIYYIESVDNKTFICCQKNVYESRKKLYELEELTLGTKLFRCSKSMILNIGKIRSVSASLNGRFEARLQNDEVVIISRQYVPELKKKLGM